MADYHCLDRLHRDGASVDVFIGQAMSTSRSVVGWRETRRSSAGSAFGLEPLWFWKISFSS